MKTITIVFAIFIAVLLNGCFIIPSADKENKNSSQNDDQKETDYEDNQSPDENSIAPDNYSPPTDKESVQDNNVVPDESLEIDDEVFFDDFDSHEIDDDFFAVDENLSDDFEIVDYDSWQQDDYFPDEIVQIDNELPDPDNYVPDIDSTVLDADTHVPDIDNTVPDEDIDNGPSYIPDGVCNNLRGGRICFPLPPNGWTHMVIWWNIIYDDRFGNKNTVLETKDYEVHFFDENGLNEQIISTPFDTYLKRYDLGQCFEGTDDGIREDGVFSTNNGVVSLNVLNSWKDSIPHYWINRFQIPKSGNFKWYVTVKMRSLTQPIWVMTGSDFWINETALYVKNNAHNTEAGRTDWVKIDVQWQTFKFGTDGYYSRECW
ncbi:MAG TPA: hypothetical protein PKH95_03350 [Candidatus Magasanikbacteria bacterium]|nr:hypothetical protein [Candidatus Magasanikbacteria bacterium]